MTGMSRYIVALAALVLLGCGPKEDQFVDVQAAAERHARGELLLDVREADDYKEFHIPNSTNIPFGRLEYRLAELESYKGKPIMLVECKWGDDDLSKSLRYLKNKFPKAAAWQIHAAGKKDYETEDGIRVAPAIELLKNLV